jgi:hypothetical protein
MIEERPVTSEPTFLGDCKTLVKGVKASDLVKERIAQRNYDQRKLDRCNASYEEAAAAEDTYIQELGEQKTAENGYNVLYDQAVSTFDMHSDFIGLILRDDPQKAKKYEQLCFSMEFKDESRWLQHTASIYSYVLADKDLVNKLSKRYNLTRDDLEKGKKIISDSREAKLKFKKEEIEAKQALKQKTRAFKMLYRDAEELYIVCKHTLGDKTDVLESLGIQVVKESIFKPKMVKDSSIT